MVKRRIIYKILIMDWIKKGNIFDKHHAQLPVVDTYHNYYRIYYSTRDKDGYSIPMFYQVYKNDLSKSLGDPVRVNLELGKPGSFDAFGIMPSSIVDLGNGIKYLYYVGWSKRLDVPYWNSTGLAISMDNGITWEKHSEGPVFATCAKEPGFIGTVDVKKINETTWLMLYSSCRWEIIEGKQEPVYHIKSAYSKNGIDWEPQKDIIIPRLNLEGGIASARLTKDNTLYFSARNMSDYRTNPENTYRIYKADYINSKFERWEGSEMVLENSELMNAYPFVINEDERDIMFYNTDFGKGGISYAIKEKN